MASSEMNDYLFVSGKNWKLSLAEIAAYLQARKTAFQVAEWSRSFFVLSVKDHAKTLFIEDLGGIIKIGKILLRIPAERVETAFLKGNKEAKTALKESLTVNDTLHKISGRSLKSRIFGVSVYPGDSRVGFVSRRVQRFLGSYFKEGLAAEGVKADFMGFSKDREFPQLTHVEVLKKHLIEDSVEILFCIGKREAYLGKTIAVHNPFDFQKRDVGRPVQRAIFSIPPRLARVMINLSHCLADKVLLDPFCGVGTILQEGLLLGARVIGVDLNLWCVEAAQTNAEWLVKEYGLGNAGYRFLRGDARNLVEIIDSESVDCVVTEPDLGPALRHIPTERYAGRIVDGLKPLYRDFLKQAYDVLKEGGKLVLVTPYIRVRGGGFVSMSLQEKAIDAGFTVVNPFSKRMFAVDDSASEGLSMASSLIEIDQRHKVGREIHVFQK